MEIALNLWIKNNPLYYFNILSNRTNDLASAGLGVPMVEPPKDCIVFPGRMPPDEICFVNAVLDDHEGMVVVRTEEPKEGRMEFWVAPDMLQEFKDFVDFVREEYDIPIEIMDPIPQSTEIAEIMKKKSSDSSRS